MGFSLFGRKVEHVSSNFAANQPVNFFDQTVFKAGTTLEVKQNEYVVATYEGQVLDIFPQGVYAIMLEGMPKLYNHLRSNNVITNSQNVKKIPVELYFINRSELILDGLTTKKVKLFAKSQKISTKIECSLTIKIIAPDVYLSFLLKDRKMIKDSVSLKLTKNAIIKDITRIIKKQELDITEHDNGLSALAKDSIAKVKLKKIGIEVTDLKFTNFKTSSKILEKIKAISDANKTLDVEFKRYTNAETEEVMLEKVGTEAYLDKALKVEVINGGEKAEDVALLNINTGEDAAKEVVFNRNEEKTKEAEIGEQYYNKLDDMLINAPQKDDSEFITVGSFTNSLEHREMAQNKEQQVNVDMFCRQCGARIYPQDKFCGNCGNRIK